MEELNQLLASNIEDIQHEMAILAIELVRAPIMKAPARRARKVTINLTKLFKRFREVTCELDLK